MDRRQFLLGVYRIAGLAGLYALGVRHAEAMMLIGGRRRRVCTVTTNYNSQNAAGDLQRYNVARGAIAGRAYTDICSVKVMLSYFTGDISGHTMRLSKFTMSGDDLNTETVLGSVTGSNDWSSTVVEFDLSGSLPDIASGEALVVYSTTSSESNYGRMHFHNATDSGSDFGKCKAWGATTKTLAATYDEEQYFVISEMK